MTPTLNLELLSEYDEDSYMELCERANYYGMDNLTEDEQYVVNNFELYLGVYL